MEFRSKELSEQDSSASVDLRYEVDICGDIDQTSVVFRGNRIIFHRMRSDRKPRAFRLTGEEFEKAIQAWTQYQEELDQEAMSYGDC